MTNWKISSIIVVLIIIESFLFTCEGRLSSKKCKAKNCDHCWPEHPDYCMECKDPTLLNNYYIYMEAFDNYLSKGGNCIATKFTEKKGNRNYLYLNFTSENDEKIHARISLKESIYIYIYIYYVSI